MIDLTHMREYRAIAVHYGERTARRSGERLIRHIDEGIRILTAIGATERAMRAFCLHPLVQQDAELAAAYARIADCTDDVAVAVLAIEYRHVANAALSTREIATVDDITLSPLAEVRDMLIADKIQNRADFERHHRATHPRTEALDRYFRLWLERLGIDEARYRELRGER